MSFILNMIKADKNEAKTEKINLKAFEKIAVSKEKLRKQEGDTENAVLKLANRKKGILITSMKDFITVYEKIKKVDFSESDGIRELAFSTISPAIFNEMKSSTSAAALPMTSGQIIATYIVRGVSGVILKESERNVSVAMMRKKQASVIESQAETICVALEAIQQRADRIASLLAKLNILFRKSVETIEVIVDKNGINKFNYSRQDKEHIMACVLFAKTIKDIIDSKLLDEDGEITKQSMEAIQVGEKYLQKISKTIS